MGILVRIVRTRVRIARMEAVVIGDGIDVSVRPAGRERAVRCHAWKALTDPDAYTNANAKVAVCAMR